jgi:imidazolonepropionase
MNTLITNIRQLVTPEGRGASFAAGMSCLKVYEGVEVLVSNGRFVSIGPSRRPPNVDRIIDAEGGVVLPGLIDPHRHLTVPSVSATGSAPQSFLSIAKTAAPEQETEENRLLRGFRRAIAGGISMVEVKCGMDGAGMDEMESLSLVQRVERATPLRVSPTLLGDCPGLEKQHRDNRISALISRIIPAVRRRRLAQFCDVTCGDGGYTAREAEAILRAARGAGLRPKIHGLGKQPEEAALLGAKLRAASVDYMKGCGGRASAALRRCGVVSVLLPGTAFFLDEAYPDARGMIDSGLAVALGTDYGFSGYGVESSWVNLAIGVEKMDLSLEEAITACTLNAAAALEVADEAGSVEPGKHADLVVLDVEDYREIRGSIGRDPVRMTIIGGRAAYTS